MEITATELKLNLGKYLEAANDEVIVITKNGKEIAKLIGTKTFRYDFSELEELKAQMSSGCFLAEAESPAYGTTAGSTGKNFEAEPAIQAGWQLTYNGEPVAQLKPVIKEKPKRKLGFMHGPPASPETIAALLEPIMTDDEYERWLNKEL